MSDSITFKYTLTEGDAVRVARFEYIHSKFLWVAVSVVGLMFAYFLLVNFLSAMQGRSSWDGALRTLLIFGGLFGAWGAFIWYQTIWTARRWPAIGVERDVTASEGGLFVHSDFGYNESTWSNYTAVLETDDFFVLWMGRTNHLAIPKRELAAISAVSDFRVFLRARLTNYRRV